MDLVKKKDIIEAIENTDWYHINSDGKLVSGANSNEDVALYKEADVYKAIDSVEPVNAIPMEVQNKINELVLEGYTVCFKFHPGNYVGIEVTYDRSYHAKHMLTNLDDIKPDHVSDCIVMVLDDLRHKIEYLKEYLEKEHESDKGIPTVDAIPVRHGRWKKIRGAINCSACKSSSWSMSFEGLVTSFNYCPNCGAKMDGEREAQNETV